MFCLRLPFYHGLKKIKTRNHHVGREYDFLFTSSYIVPHLSPKNHKLSEEHQAIKDLSDLF